MRIDIATLFVEMCEAVMNESIIGRARAADYRTRLGHRRSAAEKRYAFYADVRRVEVYFSV